MKTGILHLLLCYFYIIKGQQYCQDCKKVGKKDGPLLMVHNLFRHATRSSVESFLDGSMDYNQEGFILGNGNRATYEFGQLFRKDYVETQKFLSPENIGDTEAVSSDRGRCYETMQSFLMGLYPLGNGPKLPKNSPSQFLIPPYQDLQGNTMQKPQEFEFALPEGFSPYPYYILPRSQDVLLLGTLAQVCHPINQIINDMDNTETAMRVKRYLKTAFEVFKNQFKWQKIEDLIFFDIARMMDQTFVDLYQLNLHVPNFITENFQLFQEMYFAYIISHHLELYQEPNIQRRMTMTPLFNMIVERFDMALNNDTKKNDYQKAYFYCGSEVTVAGVLQFMNHSNHECIEQVYNGTIDPKKEFCIFQYPVPTSNVIFQLRMNTETNHPYVKIRYNGIYLPVCDIDQDYCDYKVWRKKILDFRLEGYDQFCHKQPLSYPKYPLPIPINQKLQDEETDNFDQKIPELEIDITESYQNLQRHQYDSQEIN